MLAQLKRGKLLGCVFKCARVQCLQCFSSWSHYLSCHHKVEDSNQLLLFLRVSLSGFQNTASCLLCFSSFSPEVFEPLRFYLAFRSQIKDSSRISLLLRMSLSGLQSTAGCPCCFSSFSPEVFEPLPFYLFTERSKLSGSLTHCAIHPT